MKKEEQSVEKYWKKYVKEHIGTNLKEETNTINKKFNQNGLLSNITLLLPF